jgi:hypothetical protein
MEPIYRGLKMQKEKMFVLGFTGVTEMESKEKVLDGNSEGKMDYLCGKVVEVDSTSSTAQHYYVDKWTLRAEDCIVVEGDINSLKIC